MKVLIFLNTLFSLVSSASGAILSLNISGTIELESLGDWDLVGKEYELHITYDSEIPPANITSSETTYSIQLFPSHLLLDGNSYLMSHTIIEINTSSSGPFSINFSPQSLSGIGGFYGVGLGFQSPDIFWDDPNKLPQSLDDWELNETDFSFFFSYEDANQLVQASGSSYSTISITTIPETSASFLLFISAIGSLLRRHRS